MSDNEQHANEMIPVHVVSMPTARRPRYSTVYKTVILTAAKKGEELLAPSDTRVCAFVQALDDDVLIAGRKADVETANQTGAGTIIPKANTAMTPVQDSGAVWVGATAVAGASSRVSVIDTYCVYE